MEYRYEYKDYYYIYTKLGNFKYSRDFYLSDFDNKFINNILKNHNFMHQKIIWHQKIKESRPTTPSLSNNIVAKIDLLIDNNNIDNNNIDNKIIDIVYLIDSTGSMGEEVKNASNLVIQNINKLKNIHPNSDFQFGFIYYKDPIDCNSDYNDYLQLTNDINKIKNFCNNRKNKGGGDGAEDWVGAYQIAISKIKWRNGKKIIVHICDAPAHGKKYSKLGNDNHKEKYFENQLDDLMKKCAENNIGIIGFYKNDTAKDCFLECKKIYDYNSGICFLIQPYSSNSILNINID